MHLRNRYSSLIRKLCRIYENVYFERFSFAIGHSPKAYCAKNLLVTKASFLEYEPQLWPLEFSASQKLTQSRTARYPYGNLPLNFDRKFNRKKSHNSLFLRDQTQRMRNILKALHVCIG